MTRQILFIVLPLVLPTLVYVLYMAAENRRIRAAGGDPLPWYVTAPWPWLAMGGVALIAALLTVVALTSGHPAGSGTYVPPSMGPDGNIIPGHVEPTPSSPSGAPPASGK